ncbi:hypothetical protein nbrc107696_04330 [Gordonia spumicola]|uniref:Uncharacterized protein n=1 Tax=Gordonia spumicola TaxID=589161 RepID=A0A7I9V421_9ACTN|nr:hypothetical protein nbrc107696_04330 [Gordonia spumicola]
MLSGEPDLLTRWAVSFGAAHRAAGRPLYHQADPTGIDDGLETSRRVEFHEQSFHVVFHRVDADAEVLGDGGVRQARGDEAEDVLLA